MFTTKQRQSRIADQSRAVLYGGKTYHSQRDWGKEMGFQTNPSSACARYLKKGEYKGIKLERVKK